MTRVTCPGWTLDTSHPSLVCPEHLTGVSILLSLVWASSLVLTFRVLGISVMKTLFCKLKSK